MAKMYLCTHCFEDKPLDEFYKGREKAVGWCRSCHTAYWRSKKPRSILKPERKMVDDLHDDLSSYDLMYQKYVKSERFLEMASKMKRLRSKLPPKSNGVAAGGTSEMANLSAEISSDYIKFLEQRLKEADS